MRAQWLNEWLYARREDGRLIHVALPGDQPVIVGKLLNHEVLSGGEVTWLQIETNAIGDCVYVNPRMAERVW